MRAMGLSILALLGGCCWGTLENEPAPRPVAVAFACPHNEDCGHFYFAGHWYEQPGHHHGDDCGHYYWRGRWNGRVVTDVEDPPKGHDTATTADLKF